MTVSEPPSFRPASSHHRGGQTTSSPPPPSASLSSSSPTTNTTKLNAITSPLTSNSSATNNGNTNTNSSATAATTATNNTTTTSSLPSPEHITTARTALVASLSNLVDSELQSRASVLHSNASAIDRQEKDLAKATDALRRENDKLAREADRAARKVKETGNVQNWAEVLERGFLVLEETVRLANGGGDGDGGSSCSCSCSDCGRSSRSVTPGGSRSASQERGSEGPDQMVVEGLDKGKGKEEFVHGMESLAVEDATLPVDWSDASTKLTEGSSSRTGGSESGPLSTAS